MDSSRLLDSARDPYARRQAPSMALPTSLSSGQAYYTVESLEGASSLPLLKPGFASFAPLLSERDALSRLDAQTRSLLADRETLDARARLLAAEREALLQRSVPGPSLADRRAYADGLPPVDSRTRLDGLPPVDTRTLLDRLPPADVRTRPDDLQALARFRPHGLDGPPQDALRLGRDDRGRAPAAVGGLEFGAREQRTLLEINRKLAAVTRSETIPFFPPVDSLRARRDIAEASTVEPFRRLSGITDDHTPVRAMDSSLRLRDFASRPSASSFRPQSERPFKGSRETAEAARKQIRSFTNVKFSTEKSMTKPPPEQSEGWCALCKIDCHNIKSLSMHVNGKKHKAMVEGIPVHANVDSEVGKPTPAVTIRAERKRASEAKPETSQTTKRSKTTFTSTIGNGTPIADAKKGKVDDSKKEKAKKQVVENSKDDSAKLVCEVCNITTTGQKNLESHLKGKRHTARLKELANS